MTRYYFPVNTGANPGLGEPTRLVLASQMMQALIIGHNGQFLPFMLDEAFHIADKMMEKEDPGPDWRT